MVGRSRSDDTEVLSNRRTSTWRPPGSRSRGGEAGSAALLSPLLEAEPRVVTAREQYDSLLEEVARAEQVALDTEFIGEGSYEPLLCLVQVATTERVWLVDPLAMADLRELWSLLTAPERELVVLAAREEVRFCLRFAGRAPACLVDVQLGAGLLGHGYPLSHTNLVRRLLGCEVRGGETFTDWKQRPLTARQLEYAADDVRYLLAMRYRLHEDAQRLGREEWLYAESRRYAERVLSGEQEERWWRMPGANSLGRRELGVLREVWRWREEVARESNQPPRRVLRDELLVEVARRRPASLEELFALRGLERVSPRTTGPAILEAVERGLNIPQDELPTPNRRRDPPQVGVLAQVLSLAANNLAARHRIDPALLATSADLHEVVRWQLAGGAEEETPECLQGWRGAILTETLLSILAGRSGIRVHDMHADAPLAHDG